MHAYGRTRCIAFLLLALFCFRAYRAGAAQEYSPDLQLTVNDVHFPVFLEDSTLTDDEEKAIVADYQVLLEELAPAGRHEFLKPRFIRQGDREFPITSALRYSAEHCKGPRGYNDELGIVGRSSDDQEFIVIRKKLSDGYKTAIALKKAHAEACRSLPPFVALLNSLTETEVPAAKDFFYLHGANKKHGEELARAPKQMIVEEYRGFRYTWVSILELREFEGKLLTIVYAMNKDDGHVYDRPVIYDEGRWKMFIAHTE